MKYAVCQRVCGHCGQELGSPALLSEAQYAHDQGEWCCEHRDAYWYPLTDWVSPEEGEALAQWAEEAPGSWVKVRPISFKEAITLALANAFWAGAGGTSLSMVHLLVDHCRGGGTLYDMLDRDSQPDPGGGISARQIEARQWEDFMWMLDEAFIKSSR